MRIQYRIAANQLNYSYPNRNNSYQKNLIIRIQYRILDNQLNYSYPNHNNSYQKI